MTRVPGLADDVEVVVGAEQEAQLRPRRRLVVHDRGGDHSAGTSSETTVPRGDERSRTPDP